MTIFKLIDKSLWIPLFVCVLIIFSPIFLQSENIGTVINNCLINISYSFVAAFIFYLMLDVLKRKQQAIAISPYIQQQIASLKNDVIAICKEAAHIAGNPLPDNWDYKIEDVELSFQKVYWLSTVKNMVDLNGGYITFSHFLQHHMQKTEKALNNLSSFSGFLGAESAHKIIILQSVGYHSHLKTIAKLIKNEPVGFLITILHQHYTALQDFEKWAKNKQILLDQ